MRLNRQPRGAYQPPGVLSACYDNLPQAQGRAAVTCTPSSLGRFLSQTHKEVRLGAAVRNLGVLGMQLVVIVLPP